jgi:hypothetical protein
MLLFHLKINVALVNGKLTNSFAIEISEKHSIGDAEQIARAVAIKHGFDFLGHVVGHIFHLRKRRLKRDASGDFSPGRNIQIFLF